MPIIERFDDGELARNSNIYSVPDRGTTQLSRELRTQVSDISKSASSLYTIINKQYHFMTSSEVLIGFRYPS